MAWNGGSGSASTDGTVGYLAAVIGCVAFGSFAVPIKSRASLQHAVDPLVLQSYKVILCLLTSLPIYWWIPTASTLSWWGLVSGLFMVPGGSAGYYAVRHSGLAVSQGIWSCAKVLVACAWGWLVFGEAVRNPTLATLAVTLLLIGLTGTSILAAPSSAHHHHHGATTPVGGEAIEPEDTNGMDEPLLLDAEPGGPFDDADAPQTTLPSPSHEQHPDNEQRMAWRRRTYLGLACAAVDGLYGGSVLVPMHYARLAMPRQNEAEEPALNDGLSFLPSFAVGCFGVMLGVWVVRWLVLSVTSRSLSQGWHQLPSFHCTNRVGCDAALAGLIWSFGNAATLISVATLGQGLGYSLVQLQLLVAGLWGIVWYQEVTGIRTIVLWLTFATLALTGIVLLAQERIPISKCHDG